MNHATNNNLCPVCGYDDLEDGAVSGEICSCCGTEFGYSDHLRSHEQLRQRWINQKFACWWSPYTPMPSGWSAVLQLRNIGYRCTSDDIRAIARGQVANVVSIPYNKSEVQMLPTASHSYGPAFTGTSSMKSAAPSSRLACRAA